LSGNTILFWFDCETSGLVPTKDTVLEVSWCLTDHRLRMLTPLRQRYAMLESPSRLHSRAIHFDPRDDDQWHDPEKIKPFVREMHEASGLRNDWEAAYLNHRRAMITHPRDFHRLVSEDLDLIDFKVGFDSDGYSGDTLMLAGAGVSHFDDAILTEVFDGFFPARPIVYPGEWHYRIFDTSVAMSVAGAREAVDRIAAKLAAQDDPEGEAALPFDLIACEAPTLRSQKELDHLTGGTGRAGEPEWFLRERVVAHRAADDVVYSLLDARALRHLVAQR
jgi:hypothetical protein